MNTFWCVNRWIPSRCVPLFLAFFLFFCACPANPLEQDAVCDIGAFEFFWRYAYLPLIQN